MKNRAWATGVFGVTCLFVCFLGFTQTDSANQNSAQKEKVMSKRASGTFEVKLTSQMPEDKSAGFSRMSIDKKFHGDLQGTSKGEMLAISTSVEGSAGYVAMEVVSGTLNGLTGTFALQHSGTMTRGAPQLMVTVIPDSGTGQLLGLSGRMSIQIDGGKHSYEFDYSLGDGR